jgi:hypothetical protein
MRLVFESLVSCAQGGLEVNESKTKQIAQMVENTAMSRDINDVVVVYEVAGYLKMSGSPKAAEQLMQVMMSLASMIEAAKNERAMLAGARP